MKASPLRSQLRRADTPHPSVMKQDALNTRLAKSNKKSPQEFLLFLLSGGIGTALFYLLYEFLYFSLPFQHYKATICWVISYLCSIVWQLELHRRIVFHTTIHDYPATLLKTYLVYSLSILLSTLLTHLLVESLHFHHQSAWAITLGVTGLINYFTVKDFALK